MKLIVLTSWDFCIKSFHTCYADSFLKTNSEANRKDMHIMGLGLGAHIAGYTGERLKGQLERISGLDPTGPYFEVDCLCSLYAHIFC